MALLAIRAEVQRAVIGIRRIVEIHLMAANAVRRRVRVLIVHVTLRAGSRDMRTG